MPPGLYTVPARFAREDAAVIQGLRTAGYPVPPDRLAEAKEWYSRVAGIPPYFDQPFYVGFNVGGYELGLVPDGTPGTDGATVYWGCPDAVAELARLVTLGGVVLEPVTDVGDGIKVATVRDPFGNKFGIIENPHLSLGG
jgi:predicted enzyme related to lactoylglutathione lyase